MTHSNACIDKEYSQLMKILDYRLPHAFKKIGVTGAILTLVGIVLYKHYGSNELIVKEVMRTFILVFMLMASLSKDVIEDEYNTHVRFQSYVIAFVCAIGYSIVLPIIALGADYIMTNLRGEGQISFHDTSAFEVMFMLLGFQLLFFAALKRFGRVQ